LLIVNRQITPRILKPAKNRKVMMDPWMSDSIDCSEPEARWANQFKTGFRQHVIELVFFQHTSSSEARMISRIITSPDDAKELLTTLQGTIDRYEEKYGSISHED
jgi:hypothetical protein